MFLLVKKLAKILRGAASARQIFVGALLGVMMGMLPGGINLTLAIGIFMILILNTNVGIVLTGFAVGKICCLALSSVTFQIGYVLIHGIGLEPFYAAASQTPVLALMDLNVYCLIGGLPIGVVVGLVFGILLAKTVTGLRKGILEATKRSPKMEKLAKNFFVRILLRLVFGKQKGKLADVLEKDPPVLRKGGIILAVVAVVLLGVLEFFLLDVAVKSALVAGLERSNGAEVNVGKVKVSLFAGKLQVMDLQMTDRAKPTHNLAQIKELTADISIKDLLAKQLIIEQLTADSIEMDVQRATPGRVIEKVEEPEDEKPDPDKPLDPKEVEEKLTRYFQKGKEIQKRLKQAKEFLDKFADDDEDEEAKEEAAKRSKEELMEIGRENGFLDLAATDLLTAKPTWVIRKLDIAGLKYSKDLAPASVAAENLSSHPQLNGQPVSLVLKSDEVELPLAALTMHLEDPAKMHLAKLNLAGMKVGESMNLSDSVPVDINDGKAAIAIDGQFSTAALNLPFTLKLTELKAVAREGESVLGMDPETAKEVFASITEFTVAGSIEGSLDKPKLKLDTDRILDDLNKTLVAAGKQALANRVNAEVEKAKDELAAKAKEEAKNAAKKELDKHLKKHLGDEAGGKLSKELGDKLGEGASDAVKGTLDKLWGGKKKKDEEPEEKKEPGDGKKEEDKKESLLKKFF